MNSQDEMLESIPVELRASSQYIAIFGASGKQLDKTIDQLSDLLDQTYIDMSTWSLEIWEEEYGLPNGTGKPTSERRSSIKAKKIGIGTVTKDLIKAVSEAWYGGQIEVLENYAEYEIGIKFTSNLGVPSNLDDVREALLEIIPAHLTIKFYFSYVLIEEVSRLTLEELEQVELDNFAGGVRV
ncbi:hypothetical protein J14TS2_15960 [Bacillus sp. J14TS2]|uniref:putative phage tail protein n=1 Tax=Bacillus sp. J14TS2 TaxID=2807188 RepID=UPI001B11B297|nr:putative phage tail protein [Bacillus sp. J14TS2]GIN71121.1 hypothetical protein J14TS2_15960 [Bacillus sp. J14TS2]